MGKGVKILWVSGSRYHGNGGGQNDMGRGVKALGKWVFIPWVGGSIYYG
jgi:hypothetical protein